jgi:hypothetical protein
VSPHILEVAVPINALPGPYVPFYMRGFAAWFAGFTRFPFAVFDADIS